MAAVHFSAHLLTLFSVLASASPSFPSDFLAKRSALADCLSAANVQTSLPSSATWANDTQAWNSRLSPVPAVVVYPATEDEVSAAIQCAATTSTKVTTLGGNRSFSSMGFGRSNNAMVISLDNMRVLSYDETTQLFTYGGPVRISDAAQFLYLNHSRALPHARCPDVGMSGVAFGGGFGTLSRASGTVLDNMVSVRVALANGTIVDASADANADLFWGVRGAASSLGSVLTTTLRTLDVPAGGRVVAYTIAFARGHNVSLADNAAALVGAQAWAQSGDNNDDLSIRFSLDTNSSLAGFYYGGGADAFSTVAESLLSYLPVNMTVASMQEVDFWPSENLTTPGIAEGSITARRYFYIASVTIPESHPLTEDTARSLFENTAYAAKPTDGTASGFVDIWGGNFTREVAADASAWKHDDNLLLVRWDLRTSNAGVSFSNDTMQTMRSGFYEFVNAYKADGGVPGGFPNYRDAEWTIDETAEYLYGSNWDRLLGVKKEFDPEGMFNSDPQDVPV
jgi:hypothetical protein